MTSFIWKAITYRVQLTEPGGCWHRTMKKPRWRMRFWAVSVGGKENLHPKRPTRIALLFGGQLSLPLSCWCMIWTFNSTLGVSPTFVLKLSWRGFCLWNHSCQLLPQETFRWNPKNYWLENPRATSGTSSCSFSWRKKSDQASTGQWPWRWIHQTWGKPRIKLKPAFENGKCPLFCRYGVSLCVYVYTLFIYHDVLHMQCRECTYIHIHTIVNIKYHI